MKIEIKIILGNLVVESENADKLLTLLVGSGANKGRADGSC